MQFDAHFTEVRLLMRFQSPSMLGLSITVSSISRFHPQTWHVLLVHRLWLLVPLISRMSEARLLDLRSLVIIVLHVLIWRSQADLKLWLDLLCVFLVVCKASLIFRAMVPYVFYRACKNKFHRHGNTKRDFVRDVVGTRASVQSYLRIKLTPIVPTPRWCHPFT